MDGKSDYTYECEEVEESLILNDFYKDRNSRKNQEQLFYKTGSFNEENKNKLKERLKQKIIQIQKKKKMEEFNKKLKASLSKKIRKDKKAKNEQELLNEKRREKEKKRIEEFNKRVRNNSKKVGTEKNKIKDWLYEKTKDIDLYQFMYMQKKGLTVQDVERMGQQEKNEMTKWMEIQKDKTEKEDRILKYIRNLAKVIKKQKLSMDKTLKNIKKSKMKIGKIEGRVDLLALDRIKKKEQELIDKRRKANLDRNKRNNSLMFKPIKETEEDIILTDEEISKLHKYLEPYRYQEGKMEKERRKMVEIFKEDRRRKIKKIGDSLEKVNKQLDKDVDNGKHLQY